MKFFVYGMLKSDQPKGWMIPFAKSRPHTLYGFAMYERPDGRAAMRIGTRGDYVVGEVREVTWDRLPIIGKPLKKLLLKFLDSNEGIHKGVYTRIELLAFHTYLYKNEVDKRKVIHEWSKDGFR